MKAIKILEEALKIQKKEGQSFQLTMLKLAYSYELTSRFLDARKIYLEVLLLKDDNQIPSTETIEFIKQRIAYISKIRI